MDKVIDPTGQCTKWFQDVWPLPPYLFRQSISDDKALAMLRQQRLHKEAEEAANLERKVKRKRK